MIKEKSFFVCHICEERMNGKDNPYMECYNGCLSYDVDPQGGNVIVHFLDSKMVFLPLDEWFYEESNEESKEEYRENIERYEKMIGFWKGKMKKNGGVKSNLPYIFAIQEKGDYLLRITRNLSYFLGENEEKIKEEIRSIIENEGMEKYHGIFKDLEKMIKDKKEDELTKWEKEYEKIISEFILDLEENKENK